MNKIFVIVLVAIACFDSRAEAEVVRVDVAKRVDVGMSGYEKIVGTVHFAVSRPTRAMR